MYLTSKEQALLYNTFRPSPPSELTERIITFLREQYKSPLETAVDIGCGSGQSTVGLSAYFKKVIGIDNCAEQINEANKNLKFENISYRLGNSEVLDFNDNSVQLVTAGQCAHFFDMNKFYKEVERILPVNGVLAIYGYCLPVPFYENIPLEHIVKSMFEHTINNFVSEESRLVYLKNYKTKDFEQFPFSDQPVLRENFNKTFKDASLKDLIGYIMSWSGFQRLKSKAGESLASRVIEDFKNEILETIGRVDEKPENVKLSIAFNYFLLLGRKVQSY